VKSTTLSSPDFSNAEGLRIAFVAGSRLLLPEGYVYRGHFIHNDSNNDNESKDIYKNNEAEALFRSSEVWPDLSLVSTLVLGAVTYPARAPGPFLVGNKCSATVRDSGVIGSTEPRLRSMGRRPMGPDAKRGFPIIHFDHSPRYARKISKVNKMHYLSV